MTYMKSILGALILALSLPAQAIRPGMLVGIDFDRGVWICIYKTPDGALHRLLQDQHTNSCPNFVMLP